jgi:hypothetical protein
MISLIHSQSHVCMHVLNDITCFEPDQSFTCVHACQSIHLISNIPSINRSILFILEEPVVQSINPFEAMHSFTRSICQPYVRSINRLLKLNFPRMNTSTSFDVAQSRVDRLIAGLGGGGCWWRSVIFSY